MKQRDAALAAELREKVAKFASEIRPLPGISSPAKAEAWILQMIDSIHRVKYPGVLQSRQLNHFATDPNSESFDPLKAAVIRHKAGEHDEASWLVFLFVHFGKSRKGGWRYLRDVYGMRGAGIWSWTEVSTRTIQFRTWLHDNELAIRESSSAGGFGNHRKYESLNAWKDSGTGAAVQTYVEWIGPEGSHRNKFEEAMKETDGSPDLTFEFLYNSMDAVTRFGRTARFDYLCMLGKLGLAQLRAPRPYLAGATGPLLGANLLFTGAKSSNVSTATLESWIVALDAMLGVGMQVLEDSLCNWQKSPTSYERFYG